MSYGWRSRIGFWFGGFNIPSTIVVPTVKFTGNAGLLYLKPKTKFRKFRKWKAKRRGM